MSLQQQLWTHLTAQLRSYVETNVRLLLTQVTPTVDQPLLGGRLLSAVAPPGGHPVADLIREVVGSLSTDTAVRIHGWRRTPDADVGLAIVLADPGDANRLAVVALTPGRGADPIMDVVVTPGAPMTFAAGTDPWRVNVTVDAPAGWEASAGPGTAPAGPSPVTTIRLDRTAEFQVGMRTGPGLRVRGFTLTLTTTPTTPATASIDLNGLEVAVLPAELARLIGASPDQPAAPSGSAPPSVTVLADHLDGVRFADAAALRVNLPVRLKAPGLEGRGTALTLDIRDQNVHVGVLASFTASLPALPLRATVIDTGFSVPLTFLPGEPPRIAAQPVDILPNGIAVELTLPPVAGGGDVRRLDDGGYGGVIGMDLGVIAVQAVAQFRPAARDRPTTSFLVMLGVIFPPPGIQLSFGFALDAVGGLVGINHRLDATELRRLVSDGNADRILFPDNIVDRADDVVQALSAAFPPAAGRFVIAPMVRITWGARMVALSGALILELPAPVQAVILGRLLVSIPDPVVPLIRLQASILGRFDPGIPMFEILVSLAGSWIVGLTVRGELYLLVRGGDAPEFVLSAGGFHPRYQRPAGVPALQRMQLDLRPGAGYGMRIEAYFALTTNAAQFGGQLRLEAMVAGCGIEGWLGMDALFRFEPTFSFAVAIRAGVAVRAFGHRLASVGLAFTLEGPAPWHAYGVGSVSVLFWDASLDFDIHWGSPPALAAAARPDPLPAAIAAAVSQPKAWIAEPPHDDRTRLTFTEKAQREMAAGTLVHPDSGLRLAQAVLPLAVTINRYDRRHITEQTWTVAAIRLGDNAQSDADGWEPVVDRFLRGAFFELTEDEQLTAPPTVPHQSGVQVPGGGFEPGVGHLVDDGYETGYEPPLVTERMDGWRGRYLDERASRQVAAERLDRWRMTAPMVQVLPPRLRQSTRSAVPGLVAGPVTVPAASAADTDIWLIIHDQDRRVPGRRRFLESWESPE